MSRLAYILAASHSGSTLLAMLLNAHPEVCTVGELKATRRSLGDPEQYRCSCGQRIRVCPFWQRVSTALAARGVAFDITDAQTSFRELNGRFTRRLAAALHRGPLFERVRDLTLSLSPTWRRAHDRVQQRNAALVRTLLELTGARVVVDSSKVALRLKYLLRNSALDIRVIRLIRDGRAVALTYLDPARFADASDPTLRGGGTGDQRREEQMPIAQAAAAWRRSNEEAEHLLSRLDPGRWITVHYEQLCTQTDAVLTRLFEFLGVDPARAVRDFRAVEHHVVGNGMRLDATAEVRLDERWRRHLSAAELEVFERAAGRLNRRYGYR